MFLDAGVHANHIPGDNNVITDYLSCIAITHTSATFTYLDLQTRFPWLKLSHLFQPSNELHALICSSLLTPFINIPTTQVLLGQIKAESTTSSQHFLIHRVQRLLFPCAILRRNVYGLCHDVHYFPWCGSFTPLQKHQIGHHLPLSLSSCKRDSMQM